MRASARVRRRVRLCVIARTRAALVAQYRPKKGPPPVDAAARRARAVSHWKFIKDCLRHDKLQHWEDGLPRMRRLAFLVAARVRYVAWYKIKMSGQELFIPAIELPPYAVATVHTDEGGARPAPRVADGVGAVEAKEDAGATGLSRDQGAGTSGEAAAATGLDSPAAAPRATRRQSMRWGFGAVRHVTEMLEEVPAEALGPRFVFVRPSRARDPDFLKAGEKLEAELPFEYIVQFRLAAEAELVCLRYICVSL